MRPIRDARLIGRTRHGVDLDCGDGVTCRILWRAADLARVLFIRPGGLSELRSWMILDQEPDVPWAGRDRLDLSAYPEVAFDLQETPDSLVLRTASISLKITLAPLALHWSTAGGTPFAADRTTHPYMLGRSSAAIRHYLARDPADRYYGLGDKTGGLDLHGRRLRTVMTDALGSDPRIGDPLYKHWPFTITREAVGGIAYGVFYDTMAPATFDLGCEHDNYHGLYRGFETAAGDLDYYVILGPRIRDVTAKFAGLTGRMAVGPRWSLGYACTAMPLADAPDAQHRIEQFIERCGTEDIPCSAFHFGSGYTSIGRKRYVFHWNRQKFPDPRGLIGRFNAAGMRVVANLKPCLLDDHPGYAEAAAARAFVRDGDTGTPVLSRFWDGEGSNLDFTSAAGVAWWQKGLKQAILDNGIDAAWNDNNEYEIWDETAECDGFGAPLPIGLARPLQPLLMTRASFEAQRDAKPEERPFTVTRAGCPGIQRYGQTWSGDNTTSWASLRYNLRTGLGMSLSGMFNIGHDIGGFAGPVPEPELFIRWVQAGLVHPRFIMNSWKADGTVTTPWMHAAMTPYARAAIRLRYRLMPYLYSLYRQAAERDEPILRPTFFDFDADPACFEENDEIMVGSFLLAAPVVQPGARQRQLYLPAGPAGWYDFHDGEYHDAGSSITAAAPLDRLPLFAPAGAILPMTAAADDFSRLHDEPSRCLRLFPVPGEGRSSFVLHEDDGLSRRGEVSRLTLTMESSATAIRLSLSREGGYHLPYDRITVAPPPADRRRLVLETVDAGPDLIAGNYTPSH